MPRCCHALACVPLAAREPRHRRGHPCDSPTAALYAGRDVIVNGSRQYLPQLRLFYPYPQVIWIEADVRQIRQRNEDRRRAASAALLRRLDRVQQFSADQRGAVIRLDNSGAVEAVGEKLLTILLSA